MELKKLRDRVTALEKLVKQLSKWTKFNLNNDDKDEYRKVFKPRRRTGKKSREVARKSTGGVSSRKYKIPRRRNSSDCDSSIRIKVENVYSAADEDSSFVFENIFFNGNNDENPLEDDDDYVPSPQDFSNDEGMDADYDDKLEVEVSKPPRRSANARLSKYKPLQLPSDTKDMEVTVKLDNLSAEELLEMNVKIPPTRIRVLGPWPCAHCDSVFHLKTELRKHLKVHKTKKEKPCYQCPFCPKINYHKMHHQMHVRTHTKEKPFLCYHCGFATKSGSCLNSHIKLRHSDEPRSKIKCDKCELEFLSKVSFRKHQLKIHSENGVNELAIRCESCNIILADAGKYKRHVEDVHEDKRPFSCHLCGQCFKRPNHLKKHVERHDNPNRRKRGPQLPLPVRTQLINNSKMNPLEDEELPVDENTNSCPPEEPGMQIEINHLGDTSYILPDNNNSSQENSSTIDESLVKEFRTSLGYLSE